MAISVRLPSGVVVEAETEADLRVILSVVDGVSKNPQPIVDPQATFGERLGKLPNLLRSDAQMFTVQHLVANTAGLSDEQLCAVVGVNSNRELAGVLSGIAKNLRKLSIEFGDVIIRRVNKREDGSRWYRYALTPTARDVLASAVPEVEPMPEEEESGPPDEDISF